MTKRNISRDDMHAMCKAEIARRIKDGIHPMTRKRIVDELAEHGYKLFTPGTCTSLAQYLEPEESELHNVWYPCKTLTVIEADSGLTWTNVSARKDANHAWLRENRDRLYYVANPYIVEI